MKIAIVQFPGSNCETESLAAIKRAGMNPVEFLWNEDYDSLKDFDGYFIVGGFSYEDRSRAGVIASLDPVMRVIREQSESGKAVLGICNGAQVLVETGLVPGLVNHKIGMALAPNKREKDGHVLGTGFYNVHAHLKMVVDAQRNAFTRHLKTGETIHIPLAHAEGRYVIPQPLLDEMIADGQTPFQYSTADGVVENEFPTNPNGSVHNLAAVTNKAGNVMAMMPHPERVKAGDPIFSSMRDYLESRPTTVSMTPCKFAPDEVKLDDYTPEPKSITLPIDLVITDNTALSVQKALQKAGFDIKVKRKTHWEIDFDGDEETIKNKTISSGELFNSNKEFITDISEDEACVRILVHDKEDFVGKSKLETLRDRFHISGLEAIQHSVIWELYLPSDKAEETLQGIIDTHILWNPFYQNAFYYKS